MRRHRRFRKWIWAVTLLGAGAWTGCRVTSEDIDTWKGTVKGPGKMVAVMAADKYDPQLRTYAALSLVDMERGDVDGVAELQRAIEALDASSREGIIDGLVPGLIDLMQWTPEGGKATGDQGPPAKQIRAKDAAFSLIAQATPETRKKLTEAVVRWYTADFNGRNLSGAYSAEQVVRALGSSAATLLVDALDEKLPQQALIKLAELIGQLGDNPTRERAGKRLVEIEAAMRAKPFIDWVKKQIADQLGKDVDPARVEKMTVLNQGRFIEEGALPAMKHLADQPIVGARLLEIASDPNPALTARRVRALQALEGKAKEPQLDKLLALALDPNTPSAVRDYAFDRVGDIRSPRAIPPMWSLVQNAENQRLRWRAGELVLAIGGNSVLAEFFAKLPGDAGVVYEPEELEGYASRMGQMSKLPVDIVRAQLESPDWWDRVIALRFFERKGTEADVPKMAALTRDSAAVKGKGWDKGTTVGKVAEQAIAGLRERVKLAAGGGAAGT